MSETQQANKTSEPMTNREKVIKIINSVIQKLDEADTISREAIYHELAEMHQIIETVRAEVGLASPGDISGTHIPTATDELDAVIEATAEASGTIMDVCEKIEKKAEEIGGEAQEELVSEVMKIYEACSFQDITGQRISKVVKTLQQIDQKVERLLDIMGGKPQDFISKNEDEQGQSGDDQGALLNGPQRSDQAISQEEIDRLLAELD